MTSIPNIPDEAVEAAAKAAYESTMEDGDTPWDHFGGSSYLDYFRAHARAALEAAAPHLMAQAWDEGVKAERKWRVEFAKGDEPNDPANQYRSAGAGE